MRDKRKSRILLLSSLILTLIFVYISTAWLVPTLSRYIKRQQDEIRAYYTSLYFASTGEGKTVAMEDGIGYIDFELRNYINENVTQRDIVYTISKPSVFYYENGDEIAPEDLNDVEDIYVLDVWGKTKKIENSSKYYDVEIVENNGEVISEGLYTFTHEKIGATSKGKVHTITCKITAADGYAPKDDKISLVVQLSKPYKEVLIININVSNRLITFSHKEVSVFNVPFDKIYVQTADLFEYHKDSDNIDYNNEVNYVNNYYFTSYAFKLTINWTGYMLDELKLEDIHMGTSPGYGEIGKYDTVDQYGNINESGTTPNPDSSAYIDITKSTIAFINSNVVDSVTQGQLVIYVPQGSDIFFHFLRTSTSGSIDVKIEAYVIDKSISNEPSYIIYDLSLGGYTHVDEKYNLANYSN